MVANICHIQDPLRISTYKSPAIDAGNSSITIFLFHKPLMRARQYILVSFCFCERSFFIFYLVLSEVWDLKPQSSESKVKYRLLTRDNWYLYVRFDISKRKELIYYYNGHENAWIKIFFLLNKKTPLLSNYPPKIKHNLIKT